MAAAASLRGRQGRSSLGSHAMRQMGQIGAWFWASLKSKLWRMQALQTARCAWDGDHMFNRGRIRKG